MGDYFRSSCTGQLPNAPRVRYAPWSPELPWRGAKLFIPSAIAGGAPEKGWTGSSGTDSRNRSALLKQGTKSSGDDCSEFDSGAQMQAIDVCCL